jgi:hypothetical protein
VQLAPVLPQLPELHVPDAQSWVQHCPALVHGEPAGLHAEAPQMPPVQACEQHCAGLVQERPSFRHTVPVTQALSKQEPEQQSKSFTQASPSATQEPAPHTPDVHTRLQHSPSPLQGWPSVTHTKVVVVVVVPPAPVALDEEELPVAPPEPVVPPDPLVTPPVPAPPEALVIVVPPPPSPPDAVVAGKPFFWPQATSNVGTARTSATRKRVGMCDLRVS